ncbi:MAG TPA: CDP-alcohol phosphatidyltransferase family protein [Myxococcales bacterium]|nr:CDP-alcohol phosphatidyltransferase family protein [Myxococcales bacterium]
MTAVLLYDPKGARYQRNLLGLTVQDRLERSLLRDGAGSVQHISAHSFVNGPVLLVPSTLVGTSQSLKALVHGRGCAKFEIGGAPVLRLDSMHSIPTNALNDLESWIQDGPFPVATVDGELINITNKATAKEATTFLLRSLRKAEDGLISRSLNRPMSLFTTRILAQTPITPNQWTVFTAILGVIGCLVMAQGGFWALTLGAFLIHMSSVFDGCDGELARLKFQYSKVGEWLDTICDDIVNSSLMLGLGLGIAATTGQEFYATMGITAVILNLSHAVVVYYYLYTQTGTGYALDFKWWFESETNNAKGLSENSGLLSTLMMMVRRDFFVFAFFVLCALNVPQIALWLGFIGALGMFTLSTVQTLIIPVRRRSRNRRHILNDAE